MAAAGVGDRAALAALCGPCFDEGADFTEPFLEYAFAEGEVFCVRRGASIVSMAASLPFCISLPSGDGVAELLKARYLYALCTAPEWQGRGFAGMVVDAVVRNAADAGCCAVALLPDNAALAARYGRCGFKPCAFGAELAFAADAIVAAGVGAPPVRRLTAAGYAGMREEMLCGRAHAVFRAGHLALAECFFADGCAAGFFGIGDSLAAASWRGETLAVHELIAGEGKDKAALYALARHVGASKVRTFHPASREESSWPPLMARWLAPGVERRLGGTVGWMSFTLE